MRKENLGVGGVMCLSSTVGHAEVLLWVLAARAVGARVLGSSLVVDCERRHVVRDQSMALFLAGHQASQQSLVHVWARQTRSREERVLTGRQTPAGQLMAT